MGNAYLEPHEIAEDRADKGRRVRVYDTGRKRHYHGTVLYVVRVNKAGEPDGWMVELRNGNRGCYDREHTEFFL